MNIPKKVVEKIKSIVELRLYCFILNNHHEGFWHLNWIEKQDLMDQYFIKPNKLPRALESLIKAGFLLRVKRGTYKVSIYEDEI